MSGKNVDPKIALQILLRVRPRYTSYALHSGFWRSIVYLYDIEIGEGVGFAKAGAENVAAYRTLNALRSDQSRLDRLMEHVAYRRGVTNEARAMKLLRALQHQHSWIQSVEYAPIALDEKGIDLVVRTDAGILYIQVKSSERGKKKFDAHRRTRKIAVVVAPAEDAVFTARLIEALFTAFPRYRPRAV